MISKVTLVCSKCKVEKSTDDFNKRKAMKSGFRSECKDCQKIYYQNNKEEIAEKGKIYRQNNPHKRRARNSKRRASKVQATPTWTSQIQKIQIEALHQEAVNLELATGIKYEIDHFHPLNSKYICGLHLLCNLQLLTGSENCSKSNKFECYVESELNPEDLKPWEAFYPVLSIEDLESA